FEGLRYEFYFLLQTSYGNLNIDHKTSPLSHCYSSIGIRKLLLYSLAPLLKHQKPYQCLLILSHVSMCLNLHCQKLMSWTLTHLSTMKITFLCPLKYRPLQYYLQKLRHRRTPDKFSA